MTEPIWAKVLLTMYRSEPPEVMETTDVQTDWNVDALVMASDLTETEVQEGISKLASWNLVEMEERKVLSPTRKPMYIYKLTKQGLDLANEREMNDRQGQTNVALVVLTLFLVISDIVGSLPEGLVQIGQVLILIALGWILIQTDVLNLPYV